MRINFINFCGTEGKEKDDVIQIYVDEVMKEIKDGSGRTEY